MELIIGGERGYLSPRSVERRRSLGIRTFRNGTGRHFTSPSLWEYDESSIGMENLCGFLEDDISMKNINECFESKRERN